MMYRLLVLLHVLSVFAFLMAHGISDGVAFALRRERELSRIQALLNLSGSSLGVLHGSITLLFLTGIVTGFIGDWWNRGWIWLSIGLLVAMYAYMGIAASGYYRQVRKAAGLAYMQGFKPHPASQPACPDDLDALLNHTRPIWSALVGFASLAIIAWLMMSKPF
ncbi:MAG: hypothetical protein H6659_06895 [Ardenticatenaceae bacterium]|nr:hypothetical protein [Ardenticatenaceae bacterium]